MSISYGITVCNEHQELAKLLSLLEEYKKSGDEIVILIDKDNYTDEVLEVCKGFSIRPHFHSLNNNFADHKNELNKFCSKDYIFSIDADELPNKLLMENLHDVVRENDTDLMYVPRVNTVKGITQNHIQKWGWKQNENGWINYPDYQPRIYRNKKGIKWEGKVHERIVGFDDYTKLPAYEELSLYHHKHIDRQEKQNEMYDKIQR